VAAEDQVHVLVAGLEVVGCQVADTFGGWTEEQGDGAGGPHVRRQGVVGEAALEKSPPVVVIEEILGLLPGIEGTVSSRVSRRLAVHLRKYRIR
jgi:hypothetical protein